MEQSFTYDFTVYSKNAKLNDQNVYAYEFIQLGPTTCIINNQLVLKSGSVLSRWKEDIQANEKTATQYILKWTNEADPDNALLVITKVPFIPKK